MNSKLLSLLITIITLPSLLYAQSKDLKEKAAWVDSVYNSLSLEEKIGQLFMVAAYSAGNNMNYNNVKNLAKEGKIGGVIYMQGNAEAQIQQTNELQSAYKVPLLIAMDAEWGLGMRLTGVKDYPKQMLLGATDNVEFMERLGFSIGKQLKNIGVHIDFAPVVDVNNNPENPIINFRSFGEDKNLVSRMGIAYMNGLHKAGILAVAKHFPGHGDVSVDSHHDTPIIPKTVEQLNHLEFYPFKRLMAKGLKAILTSHLSIPEIDNRNNRPATVSYPIITEHLKEKLHFKGLIFTDALNMKGITKHYSPGEVDLEAFLAGNDVLLFSENAPRGIQLIKKAYEEGKVSEERLALSVRKILALKYDNDLHNFKAINGTNATQKANEEVDAFLKEATALSATKWKGNTINGAQRNHRVLHISINERNTNNITSYLRKAFDKVDHISSSQANFHSRVQNLKADSYDFIIISIHSSMNYPGKNKTYGVPVRDINAIQNLIKQDNVYTGLLINPYLGNKFCNAKNAFILYENNEHTQKQYIDILLNHETALGKSPVSICK